MEAVSNAANGKLICSGCQVTGQENSMVGSFTATYHHKGISSCQLGEFPHKLRTSTEQKRGISLGPSSRRPAPSPAILGLLLFPLTKRNIKKVATER